MGEVVKRQLLWCKSLQIVVCRYSLSSILFISNNLEYDPFVYNSICSNAPWWCNDFCSWLNALQFMRCCQILILVGQSSQKSRFGRSRSMMGKQLWEMESYGPVESISLFEEALKENEVWIYRSYGWFAMADLFQEAWRLAVFVICNKAFGPTSNSSQLLLCPGCS